MKWFIVVFMLLPITLQVSAQEILHEFYDLEVRVVKDSLYEHYCYKRKVWHVELQCFKGNGQVMSVIMKSRDAGADDYVTGMLGWLEVVNYEKKMHVCFSWLPKYGDSYLGTVFYLDFYQNKNIKTVFLRPDGSYYSIHDHTKEQDIRIYYEKGEKYPDLSLAKTFTMYFYNLYNERVLKKGRN